MWSQTKATGALVHRRCSMLHWNWLLWSWSKLHWSYWRRHCSALEHLWAPLELLQVPLKLVFPELLSGRTMEQTPHLFFTQITQIRWSQYNISFSYNSIRPTNCLIVLSKFNLWNIFEVRPMQTDSYGNIFEKNHKTIFGKNPGKYH